MLDKSCCEIRRIHLEHFLGCFSCVLLVPSQIDECDVITIRFCSQIIVNCDSIYLCHGILLGDSVSQNFFNFPCFS